jgi:hypothetical protein
MTETESENEADTLREVWNDTDGESRREFWTDGEWIKVGRDVDDPALCVTFRFEDRHYDEFRYGDHPKKVKIEDDRGSSEKYIVDTNGYSYRFYKDRKLVLEVPDHELGTIRSAYRTTAEFRDDEYDWEDVARSFVQGLYPNQFNFEITELNVGENNPSGGVTVEHSDNVVRASDAFIESIKESEHADWVGIYHDGHDAAEEPCGGFRYEFRVDAASVQEEIDG